MLTPQCHPHLFWLAFALLGGFTVGAYVLQGLLAVVFCALTGLAYLVTVGWLTDLPALWPRVRALRRNTPLTPGTDAARRR